MGALVALAANAEAQTPASAQEVTVPGKAGQPALVAELESDGVRAQVCPSPGPCDVSGGPLLRVPEAVREHQAAATLTPYRLAGGAGIVELAVPTGNDDEAWVLWIASPKGAEPGASPKVIWHGWTGRTTGDPGERRSTERAAARDASGAWTLSVEKRFEEVSLCGRPIGVSVRVIDPGSLELVPIEPGHRWDATERAAAKPLTASWGEANPGFAVLHARGAGASQGFDKLSDGDLSTVWTESLPGAGRGEIAVFRATDAPLTGIDLVAGEGASIPNAVYIATDDALFRAELKAPEDPAQRAASLKFATPITTRCVAVVLDGTDGADVGLAEVVGRTAFDGQSVEALVGALAGGGERAEQAAALLRTQGDHGARAAIEGYAGLDEAGQLLALTAIDAGSCDVKLPFYLDHVASEDLRTVARAVDRFRICRDRAAPYWIEILGKGEPGPAAVAAEELGALKARDVVDPIVEAMAEADDDLRKTLRSALSRLARRESDAAPFDAVLNTARFEQLSEKVQVDFLRAMGERLATLDQGPQAFGVLAPQDKEFRTRYLVMEPAGVLATAGDPLARAFVERAMQSDEDPFVRVRAAEIAGGAQGFDASLQRATSDPHVRVRQAALASLEKLAAEPGRAPGGLLAAALDRLAHDRWTMVRRAAAATLAEAPADPVVDKALAAAMADDASPLVRIDAIHALGERRAAAYGEALEDIADDTGEFAEVRGAAMVALAKLCFRDELDAWTELAHFALFPVDDADRILSTSALRALAIVHPNDLEQRLAPLLDPRAPRTVREIALHALEQDGACR